MRDVRATSMIIKRCLTVSLLFLLAGFTATTATSCGGSRFQVPTVSMPSGATFTGRWYSNYGRMEIIQNGNEVSGTFDYKDGGTIAGTVKGAVLEFDWVQHGDLAVGRREQRGKGYLVLKTGEGGGYIMEGEWGFDENYVGGGAWTGEYLGELE